MSFTTQQLQEMGATPGAVGGGPTGDFDFSSGREEGEFDFSTGESETPERGLVTTLLKRPLERLVFEPARRTGEALVAPFIDRYGTPEMKRRMQEAIEADVAIKLPIFGEFRTRGLKPENAGKQILGETLETAGWLYGPGKAFASAPFFKRLLIGGVHGAIGAGLFGAGEEYQKGGTTEEALKRAVEYAPYGLAGGAIAPSVLGAAVGTPLGMFAGAKAGRGVGGRAAGALREGIAGMAEGFFGPEMAQKLASSKLSKEWEKLYKLTPTQTQYEARTGRAAHETMARHPEIIPEMSPGGRLNTIKSVRQMEEIVRPEQEAMNEFMAGRQETIPLSRIVKDMKAKIRATGTDKDKAFRQIKEEVKALVRQDKSKIIEGADGEKMIPASLANRWKQGLTQKIPESAWIRGLSIADQNKLSVYYRMADALDDNLQRVIKDVDFNALNRQLSDYYHAIEMLKKRHGIVVEGGRLTGLFAQLLVAGIGATVGGMISGPWGAGGGALLGQQVSRPIYNILRDPTFRTAIPRWVLQRAEVGGGPTVAAETAAAAARTAAERAGQKALPAGAIEVPPGGFTPRPTSGVQVVPAARGIPGRDPKTGRFFRTYTSEPARQRPGGLYEFYQQRTRPQIYISSVIKRGDAYFSKDGGEATREQVIQSLKMAREIGIPIRYADLPEGEAIQTSFHRNGAVEFTVAKEFQKEVEKTLTEKVKGLLKKPPLGLSTKDITKDTFTPPQRAKMPVEAFGVGAFPLTSAVKELLGTKEQQE